jgi:hypothetical protein
MRIGAVLPVTALWAMTAWANNLVITVGAGGQYQRIDEAVAVANADTESGGPQPFGGGQTQLRNYYTINITPGVYQNDFADVMRPMTIQVDPAFPGKRVILKATIPLPNQKGIIHTTSSLQVNGLVFTGAQIDESLGGNGAGIRDQNPENTPASLIVENSIFENNQAAILQGNDIAEDIAIINSEFKNNGVSHTHAVYIDEAATLTVIGSLFCGHLVAHNIKSRAAVATFINNRIYDGAAAPASSGCRVGSSRGAIDVANGGIATIRGNLLVRGPASSMPQIIRYGEENLGYGPDSLYGYGANSLYVTDNRFVATGPGAIGIYDPQCVLAHLVNNSYSGIDSVIDPPRCLAGPTIDEDDYQIGGRHYGQPRELRDD